ncbi:Low calcium response locus protein H [Chlamydiales bacterium STE3]|nr:Low calcium response locus protein H [Chlamydiales bacterium STE3]
MKHSKHGVRKAVRDTGEHIHEDNGKDFSKITNKAIKNSGLIKDIIGLTDESAEGIYSQAYLLYNTGKYSDAAEIFRLLIMLNAMEPKYTMGLAACFHMMKEYESAASAYSLVSIVDPESPIPYFHASDCYIQMGDRASAIVSLDMAAAKASDKPEFAMLKERATITLQALRKEVAEIVQQSPKKP